MRPWWHTLDVKIALQFLSHLTIVWMLLIEICDCAWGYWKYADTAATIFLKMTQNRINYRESPPNDYKIGKLLWNFCNVPHPTLYLANRVVLSASSLLISEHYTSSLRLFNLLRTSAIYVFIFFKQAFLWMSFTAPGKHVYPLRLRCLQNTKCLQCIMACEILLRIHSHWQNLIWREVGNFWKTLNCNFFALEGIISVPHWHSVYKLEIALLA